MLFVFAIKMTIRVPVSAIFILAPGTLFIKRVSICWPAYEWAVQLLFCRCTHYTFIEDIDLSLLATIGYFPHLPKITSTLGNMGFIVMQNCLIFTSIKNIYTFLMNVATKSRIINSITPAWNI